MVKYSGPTAYDTFIECGTEVFYLFDNTAIVKATVIETDNVFIKEGMKESIWATKFIIKEYDSVSMPTGEVDENGWNKYEQQDWDAVKGLKQCSQFLWIDEPTGGHAITLGDECFLTLSEAMKYIYPSRKKYLKRRLNRSRSYDKRFIVSTWTANGESHPGFDYFKMKKVYVRKA